MIRSLGQPVVLVVRSNGWAPGLVHTEITFPTVHFNGATGQPTYPHMGSGMLKSVKERAKLIKHVRDLLPAKGAMWQRLLADGALKGGLITSAESEESDVDVASATAFWQGGEAAAPPPARGGCTRSARDRTRGRGRRSS